MTASDEEKPTLEEGAEPRHPDEDDRVDVVDEAEPEETEEAEGEEFAEDLLELATVVGVDPDDYDDEGELERAIYKAAGAQQPSVPPPKEGDKTTPEELALEVYDFELSEEDIDAKLIAQLQNFSKVQTERFVKAINDLRKGQGDKIARLEQQVQHLSQAAAAQSRQQDHQLLDEWIQGNEEAEQYFGKGTYAKLDPDSAHAKRRRAQITRAYGVMHGFAQKKGGRMPGPGRLFDLAFVASRGRGKAKASKKRDKTPTSSARPTRSSAKRRAAGAEGLSEKEKLAEGGKAVEQWQRQHGFV